MRLAVCSVLLSLVSTALCSTCLKNSLDVFVPEELEAEQFVFRVDLGGCLRTSDLLLSSSDPDFIIHEDGSVFTTHSIRLPSELKTFNIWVEDTTMHDKWAVEVTLSVNKVLKKRHSREAVLKRSKRRWRPLPFSFKENSLGPFPEFLQQIRSDFEQQYQKLYYSISGPGVDLEPVGLFSILRENGSIFVHRTVDRETYPEFKLIGNAYTDQGFSPEQPLDITIKVIDDNDNTPAFTQKVFMVSVPENAISGTSLFVVNATDADDPETMNAQLKYRIISQAPIPSPPLFIVHPVTGVFTLGNVKLDRERQDNYQLLMEVRDMNGESYGRASTGTVSITVGDANDNAPSFRSSSYTAEVFENEENVTILRIPVDDKDLVNTSNWKAKFTILKGNENGNFKIETDPITNEGILKVVKPLDYEKHKTINLEVGAENEAPFVGPMTKATVPISVNIKNVDEGPEFEAPVKIIRTAEGRPNGTLIGKYTAKDPETQSSTGIKYKKISDLASWVSIDENTGDIKTTNILDRESSYVKNDEYNITVLATDPSSKSSTGTVVIQLIDVNDNNPTITTPNVFMCKADDGNPVVTIAAEDLDKPPNSSPFTFSLPENPPDIRKHWKIERISATEAHLSELGDLSIGYHQVPVLIQDQQGKGTMQTVKIRLCRCPDGINCAEGQYSSVGLGLWAILAMILAALLLLCILLSCFCGGDDKKKSLFIEDGTHQHLIMSNTEGPGENVMDGNFKIPLQPINQGNGGKGTSMTDIITRENNHPRQPINGSIRQVDIGPGLGSGREDYKTSQFTYSEWLHFMQSHIGEKVYMCGQEEEKGMPDDYLHEYYFEGVGSPAGSVGCCSNLGDEDRLDFLNNLGPRFKHLAEICTKK